MTAFFYDLGFVKLLPNDVFGKRWGKKNEKDGHDFLEKKG